MEHNSKATPEWICANWTHWWCLQVRRCHIYIATSCSEGPESTQLCVALVLDVWLIKFRLLWLRPNGLLQRAWWGRLDMVGRTNANTHQVKDETSSSQPFPWGIKFFYIYIYFQGRFRLRFFLLFMNWRSRCKCDQLNCVNRSSPVTHLIKLLREMQIKAICRWRNFSILFIFLFEFPRTANWNCQLPIYNNRNVKVCSSWETK